jgi:hypothetical protein
MAKKILIMVLISVLLSVLATIVVNKLNGNCPLCKEEEPDQEAKEDE